MAEHPRGEPAPRRDARGGGLGEALAVTAARPDDEPQGVAVAEPVLSAVPVRVGGGAGGGAEGAAAGRHAAADAAPRYSVSSESQGVGATEPLGQKCPKGQMVVAFAAVPGEGQKKPAGQLAQNDAPAALYVPAAQGMQAAEEGAPEEVEYVPAGQAVHVEGAAAPTKALYVPAPQRVQVAFEAAPVADDQVPAEQGKGLTEDSGQCEPAGQSKGAPEAQ